MQAARGSAPLVYLAGYRKNCVLGRGANYAQIALSHHIRLGWVAAHLLVS
jgi:hypothetical protein